MTVNEMTTNAGFTVSKLTVAANMLDDLARA